MKSFPNHSPRKWGESTNGLWVSTKQGQVQSGSGFGKRAQHFLMHLSPPDCEGYSVEQWCLAGYGETGTLVISGSPGQEVWLAVAPRSKTTEFFPDVAEYTYLLSLNSGVVGVEETSWGSVKALYR